MLEKKSLDSLFTWVQEGFDENNFKQIVSLSGLNLDATNNQKDILKIELGYLYLFFLHGYCKNIDLPHESMNILFNRIFEEIIRGENTNAFFRGLNQRLSDYAESYSSKEGGKLFGITGLFLIFLRKADESFMSGITNQQKLIGYLNRRLKLLFGISP